MAPNVVTLNTSRLNPARLRQWILRLPFITRSIFFVILGFWVASLFLAWIPQWGALIPTEVGLLSMHRLNTYPVVHSGTIPTIINTLGVIPLIERFEAEHGSLVTAALFGGPFATLPGLVYILVDHTILRGNAAIQGAATWICLLLACEAVKTFKTNPYFQFGSSDLKIPTWTSPIILILVIHFLIPQTSLLGNASGALIGYGFELGYLKFLIPPERILKWLEGKLNLLGRLPYYVSVDQKTFGRYGVLPSARSAEDGQAGGLNMAPAAARNFMAGSSQQRLGSVTPS